MTPAGRVAATDWDAVRADLDAYGCGLTGPLLTPDEAAGIAALYPDGSRFRSTVNMARHRFGEGEYRYFAEPFPAAVAALKQALWPMLLPIARVDPPRPGYTLAGQPRGLAGGVPRRGPEEDNRDPAPLPPATGTPCTATSTATWCSRCRS